MTQEDKNLLLQDLCGRLPYGVKVKTNNINILKLGTHTRVGEYVTDVIEPCKPYLFPLSSMTEEQKEEYHSIIYRSIKLHYNEYCDVIDIDFFDILQEFYLKNHFDYRGLIPKGLAIDCTNLNIY